MKLKSAKQLCKDLELSAESKENQSLQSLIMCIEQQGGEYIVDEYNVSYESIREYGLDYTKDTVNLKHGIYKLSSNYFYGYYLSNFVEDSVRNKKLLKLGYKIQQSINEMEHETFKSKIETVQKKFLFCKYKVKKQVPCIETNKIQVKRLTFSACCKNEVK